ncbi:MAG: hypothetical protein O2795_05290 [Acidobacteria bacterium]|nr:hypothetical protein [Acidobacteriota bacterium]
MMNRSFAGALLCAAPAASWACAPLGPPAAEIKSPEAPVSFEQGDDQIGVSVNGKAFTSFRYEERWDKPFLYPLTTASGRVISRGYPVEPREVRTALQN